MINGITTSSSLVFSQDSRRLDSKVLGFLACASVQAPLSCEMPFCVWRDGGAVGLDEVAQSWEVRLCLRMLSLSSGRKTPVPCF